MKNLKLLLATTAILFASNSFAAPVSENFSIKIKLLTESESLTKIKDLDFGQILAHNVAYAGKTVELDPDGTVSGSAEYYGGAQPAIIRTGTYDGNINHPYDINISSDNTLKGNDKLCGYVSNWQHTRFLYRDGSDEALAFKIGATFTLPNAEDWKQGQITSSLECTGSATATLIYTGQ